MSFYVVRRSKNDKKIAEEEIEGHRETPFGHEIDPRIGMTGGFVVNDEHEAKKCVSSWPGWEYVEYESLDKIPIAGGESLTEEEKQEIKAQDSSGETNIGKPYDDGDDRGVGVEINRNWNRHSDKTKPAPKLSEMNKESLKEAAKTLKEVDEAPDVDLRSSRDELEDYVRENSHFLE